MIDIASQRPPKGLARFFSFSPLQQMLAEISIIMAPVLNNGPSPCSMHEATWDQSGRTLDVW